MGSEKNMRSSSVYIYLRLIPGLVTPYNNKKTKPKQQPTNHTEVGESDPQSYNTVKQQQ